VERSDVVSKVVWRERGGVRWVVVSTEGEGRARAGASASAKERAGVGVWVCV
jgi:hypothetical protein